MSLARIVGWINYRQGWRTLFWASLLVGTAAVLDLVPLFDVLGYDSAFALGLLAAFAGVDVGHGVVSAARRQQRPTTTPRLAAEAMVTVLALLVLPLLILLANAVRVRNCNLGAGLAFFALLPVATVLFAAATGAAVTALVPRPRVARLLAFALPVVSLAWALLRFYRNPAVFAFDPFGGYFPGPIYDEALRPPLRLLWFRLANLTWLGAAVALASWLRPRVTDPLRLSLRPWSRSFVGLALLVGSWLWFAGEGALGIHVTHAELEQILPRVTLTPHFVLRTDATAENDSELALAAQDLEFRYQQLAHTLGVTPSGTIRVYRFPSPAAKKEAVGAGNTLYAKPWTRELFVQAERFPAQRLRHELAHVFAGAFGDRRFGIALAWHWWGPLPVPRLASGLVEGLAEAADYDNPSGRSTVHEEAAAMIALGQAPPLADALGAGFSTQSGPRAYTVVGSFCRYLLDTHGADQLRALYRSAGDFLAVYGQGLPTLEQGWRAFLATLPVDEGTRAEAQEDFRRPAIFHKVCARDLAARVSDARIRLPNAPAESVALLDSVCADDPGEPTYRLDLAEAQIAAGEPDRALATLRAAEAAGLTRPLRGRAANLEAGVHFRAGRIAETEAALARALAAATEDADQRFVKARQRALRDPQSAATLGRVFFGDERGRSLDPALALHLLTEFARQNPDEALGPYLVARQLVTRDPKLAIPYLADACPFIEPQKPHPLDATFFKECRRLLGESAYLAHQPNVAREAFTWLVEHADHEADRLRAKDFLARVAWQEQLQPSAGSGGTTLPHDRPQVRPR
jgi:hypothetical protein